MKSPEPNKPKPDSLYGIDENTLLEKLYTQSRPLRLWEIEALWPVNFTEKTGTVFRLLGVLVNKGLISHTDKRTSANDTWHINEKGKQKIEGDAEAKERVKEGELLAHIKLKFDAKNSERIYRTYWYSFGIAIASFVIALISLILSLRQH